MGVCSITAAFAEFVADGHGAYGQLVEGDVFDVVLPAEEMVGGGVVEAVAVEDEVHATPGVLGGTTAQLGDPSTGCGWEVGVLSAGGRGAREV